MNLKNKQEIIEKFGANAKDTGSAEVQIAMLTKKISELTEHMKANKKDFATKRGLLMMVGKRKRLLSFLKEKNLEGYRSLIKELGIRGQGGKRVIIGLIDLLPYNRTKKSAYKSGFFLCKKFVNFFFVVFVIS